MGRETDGQMQEAVEGQRLRVRQSAENREGLPGGMPKSRDGEADDDDGAVMKFVNPMQNDDGGVNDKKKGAGLNEKLSNRKLTSFDSGDAKAKTDRCVRTLTVSTSTARHSREGSSTKLSLLCRLVLFDSGCVCCA